MSKLDRIAKLGTWPRVLNAELAALYCGLSATAFLERVEHGIYPKPFPNGALVQWDRHELDDAIDVLKQTRKTSGTKPAATSSGLDQEIDSWTPESSARQ